ncbi:hypothetical protein PLANPX_2135 [Lacipirellula parvula]|uniref:Uncharacterized protein n=1 Tax=Lacipirellula parvula TaxID=2650471 RepID=A0A5K7XE53_9BACT|nr:hypothetical protein PLANPX_2135 [Lacipirellula parvula]
MLKAIRYTLAAICLAASVGCLALWWRSMNVRFEAFGAIPVSPQPLCVTISRGQLSASFIPPGKVTHWRYESYPLDSRLPPPRLWPPRLEIYEGGFSIPLWLPSALSGAFGAVAIVRIKRFSLRSALVGMSVVAALLGMIVAL